MSYYFIKFCVAFLYLCGCLFLKPKGSTHSLFITFSFMKKTYSKDNKNQEKTSKSYKSSTKKSYTKDSSFRKTEDSTKDSFQKESKYPKKKTDFKDKTKSNYSREEKNFKTKDKGKNWKPKKSETSDKQTPVYNLKFYEKKNQKNKKKVEEVVSEEIKTDIRLNRFIANAGVCSRREADELIAQGFVKVNGQVITEMGYQVKPSDKVTYKGKLLKREKLVYILLNKPKNCITTTDDPEERHTVMEIVKDACDERVYPVGRLDRNTTGLLLLTNDGDLAKKLSHPSSNIKKIYQVSLDKPITESDFYKIQEGFELEDGFIKPDALALLTPNTLGIELHSGRNRIVRRIFEHLGYSVEKLDRTMYAGLTKKDLPRGKWRFLSQKEVALLKFSKIRKTPQR
jgi:23S rRNA pseudouridine2605 synthase